MTDLILSTSSQMSMGGDSPVGAGDLVKDSDTRGFMADVVEASKQVPVLVDFWAPWCGPCKQLGPTIEKVVRAANGKVRLVKINVDENQAIAGQMRIQSIPAVFAFVDGQPVDGFMGALPESEIKAFVDRLTGDRAEADIAAVLAEAGEAMAKEDFARAGQAYAAVLQNDRENTSAIAGLVRCQIAAGDLEGARATLTLVPPGKQDDADIASAGAALELAENPVDESEVTRLAAAVEADPADLQARFDLAVAQNRAGMREAATDNLVHIIKRDRQWNDDAARGELVRFFEAWGHADPATVAGRRKLSAVLFS